MSYLALVNLARSQTFVFGWFPNEDRTQDRANWEPQETTTGVKPLFYANRDPRRIDFRDLYLDHTETGESLTPTLRHLQDLMVETEPGGSPPPLLAIWGDREERCVLEDLMFENIFFNDAGEPLRSRISISLLELQPDREGTGVRVGSGS